ncbi:DegV family protein [Bacillota bacterium LX-D]|nr:DegV family protein [Bacillota bacterium LX-D]
MVRILTDSSCELTPEQAEELGVTVIPLIVNIENVAYKDRIDITPEQFYELLTTQKALPTTAQITPRVFLEHFTNLVEAGEEVLALIFSSALSGTFQSAVVAKNMLTKGRVEVIDTKCASVGLGLVVTEAAKMAQTGADMETILAKVQTMCQRMEHIILVNTLDMLKKGGRISSTRALVGGMLNVKPILQIIEGAIVPLDNPRGWKKALSRMEEIFKARGGHITQRPVSIGHCANEEKAEELYQALQEQFLIEQISISKMGPVIGTHVGFGTIGLAFERNE